MVVVGAGVVGLSIARALTLRGQNVLVLERHARAGTQTSSRNSEVIHAGLYYAPGSLKARLCVAGRHQLYDFCRDHGIAHARRGKLIVASRPDDVATLQLIQQTAALNGVNDLVLLTSQEARALEPALRCHAALLSPSTGVFDSAAYITALEGHVSANSGQIIFNALVSNLDHKTGGGFIVTTTSGGGTTTLTANRLILAAGLAATPLGAMLTPRKPYALPRTYFAKGHYFSLSGAPPFQHLVYPLPNSGSLGLHYTLDTGGQAKFGPDIEWRDHISYDFEGDQAARLSRFETATRAYWPGLPDGALSSAYTGIRPKLAPAREPAADFAIHTVEHHGIESLVALYGIESPGLTASLAIGEYVADRLVTV